MAATATAGAAIVQGAALEYFGASVRHLTSTGVFAGTAVNNANSGAPVLVYPPGETVVMLCEAVSAGNEIHPKVSSEHIGTAVTTDARVIGRAAATGGGAGGVFTGVRSEPQ